MKNIFWIICCITVIYSCNNNKKTNINNDKLDSEPIEDSTWLKFEHVNKKSDSLKITLYHSVNLDSIKSYIVRNRYSVFYFTFEAIPDEELKNIGFLEDEKFDKKRDEYNISTIHFDSSQTKRSFYMKFPENKTYHLNGLIQDNILIESKDSIGESYVRKLGRVIKRNIDFEKNKY